MLWILVSSCCKSENILFSSDPGLGGIEDRAGCQLVSASSIAIELFSSSVRRTVASFVRPAATAALSWVLKDRRCDRRWIIGQRSVENPRRVSTALSGESGILPLDDGGTGNGSEVGCVFVLGDVPIERAAITS